MERNANLDNSRGPGICFLAAAFLTALALFWPAGRDPNRSLREPVPPGESPVLQPGKLAAARHPVYAFSVVPGGVHSREDLQFVLAHDPLVKAHYSGFQAETARVLQLPADKFAYVSFRVRNQIYWTKKKVRLPKGERVITDGTHYARTRCGNRISEVPQAATTPEEPTQVLLDISVSELTVFERKAPVHTIGWSLAVETSPGVTATSLVPPAPSGDKYPAEAAHTRTPPGGIGMIVPPSTGSPSTGMIVPPSTGSPSTPMLATNAIAPTTPAELTTPRPAPLSGTESYLAGPDWNTSAAPQLANGLFSPTAPINASEARMTAFEIVHPSVAQPGDFRLRNATGPTAQITTEAFLQPDVQHWIFAAQEQPQAVRNDLCSKTESENSAISIPPTPVLQTPEPGTLFLFSSGFALFLGWRERGRLHHRRACPQR